MMYGEAALKLLAELEGIQIEDNLLLPQKFGYVVATQVYGLMKKNQEQKAEDIEFLLKRHRNLRVAYIDELRNRKGESNFYSVLTKGSDNGPVEVYRVGLPGNPVVGEGKPENQNHAIIFARGQHVMAMDMNQDGYFEEALKIRNMLEEFKTSPSSGVPAPSIVGFREHIFTGSVSSLANYMALQETSFVTLGQRVLDRPLRIRQHYGHPDMFDKVFVMTKGGMSKASRGINLSEDIFAGYNATIRGNVVKFREYMQVGKGRDVGMQQIYKFEAKLSQGAAEQSLSRDVDRVCERLDFFRLLSFFYGGIGHYVTNVLVIAALHAVLYSLLLLALYRHEKIGSTAIQVRLDCDMYILVEHKHVAARRYSTAHSWRDGIAANVSFVLHFSSRERSTLRIT
jgi:callose synthase